MQSFVVEFAHHNFQNQSRALVRLFTLKTKMLVPSAVCLKKGSVLLSRRMVVDGGHVIQKVRSTNEYIDRCVLDDLRVAMNARCL